LTLGVSQIAILPPAGFSLLGAPANGMVFHFTTDRGAHKHFAQPRSRGPPTFA
jgi:hypothetical protein